MLKMIAKLLKILIAIQIAIAGGFFLLAIKFLHMENLGLALAFGFALVLSFRLLITGHNFFLAWRFHSETPEKYYLSPAQKVRLFFGEFYATMTSSSWTMIQPFDRRMVAHSVDLPVLLIHGYACNSGYWKKMSDVLARECINHHAIDLEPVFGGIDDFVPLVERAIEALCLETASEKVIVLAHSMGGLVARAYLRKHGGARIAKVITLGTPHNGTGLAQSGPGVNSMQMRWTGSAKDGQSSAWLQQLAASETPATRALFASIYSHHDNIVSPQASSELAGATNIAFHGIGHVELALHPLILRSAVDEIHRASAGNLDGAAGGLTGG